MSAFYQLWQIPTADRHKNGTTPQMRNPSEVWQLNCNNWLGKVTPERQEWHVFAKNPFAPNNNGQWPDAASYVPLDQSTPNAISTLVQDHDGGNPWTSAYAAGTSGKTNTDRHVSPPEPNLIALLTKDVGAGGYGLSLNGLFTRGIERLNLPSAKDQGGFYNASDCGY